MTYYDNEDKILESITFTSIRNTRIHARNKIKALIVLLSIKISSINRLWINNATSTSPPDYLHSKLNLMMEVMRFDDYPDDKRGQNAKESKLRAEIESKLSKELKEKIEDGYFIIYINTRTKVFDNSFQLYQKNLKRVLIKHIEKIKNYKNNHPKRKLIFLVFDEAKVYLESKNEIETSYSPGELFTECRFYYPYTDKEIIAILKDAQIDYIIWYQPYIKTGLTNIEPAQLVIIDKKFIETTKGIEYNYKKIVCGEQNIKE